METLDKLKEIAENQKLKQARLDGKIESVMEELEEEGFTSVKKAEKSLLIDKRKVLKRRNIFKNKMKAFEEKYAEELQKIS
jgi:hypothetical protein